MRRTRISVSAVALMAAAALTLSACGSSTESTDTKNDDPTNSQEQPGDDDGDAGDNDGDAGDDDGGTSEPSGDVTDEVIRVNGNEPENKLLPSNTNEVGGGKILDAIFAGLAYYDGEGSLQLESAESIDVDADDQLTVKIKPDLTFTNGEPVDADSFITAWQYGALTSNAQLNQFWWEDIEGYNDEEDSELTGLQKVDDLTFTIKLTSPIAADFAQRLGYSAFYPMPASAWDDLDAYGEAPIGNGPYKLASDDAWDHDRQIDLVKNEEYQGGRTVHNGGLTIVFYSSQEAAYADLISGEVDVIDGIPPAELETFEDDLGDRAVNQPAAIFQSFTIPQDAPHFSGEEGVLRRQAISLSIDRAEITDVVFSGSAEPAKDFTSPVVDGFNDSLPGSEVLGFDPDKAKELWAEADAISPWEGTFEIGFNADGGHQEWVDAVTNSIKNALGIDAASKAYADFATLRGEVNDRTIDVAFRTGWQADYPSQYNFLQPLYGTNAGANDGDYSNADFDALLASGASAADPADSLADYAKAQEILLQELPAIPLWYSNVRGGIAEGVSNVVFGWNSVPLYYDITK